MTLTPYELIRRKRDGEHLASAELAEFLDRYAQDRVPDYQMAAFLMAVYVHGLSGIELDAMVQATLDSGTVLDLSDIPGPKVDKHSTGGVGDKVSLVLAPLAASLGLRVPMMSGRGLGHTGGTLDKLESIPGFRTDLSIERMRSQLATIGCALIGPSQDLAPLDGRLYALRNATATVASIPLIAASIMSKKIAEGAEGLVLNLTRGEGGFIPDLARLEELGRTMIAIGAEHGCAVTAFVTAMDRPLGRAVGNALEVEEAMAALRGDGPDDLREVTLALAAEMLVVGGLRQDSALAGADVAEALDSGRAARTMERIVEAQDGDPRVVTTPGLLATAPVRRPVLAVDAGWVHAVRALTIGRAAVALGAGARSLEESIDPAVGFEVLVSPGDRVEAGAELGIVHAADDGAAREAERALLASIPIAREPGPEPLPLISHRVDADGAHAIEA
ncbi:MAG: thymidine phosphorylase [Gemmatimonadota bacterium]